MAGLAETNTIDLIAQDADGTYLLIMVEDRRWGVDPDQARQLKEKLNTYAYYVLDGSLSKQYPETATGPIRVRLDCAEAPAGHFAHIAAHFASQLAAHGIDFQVRLGGIKDA